MRPLRRAQVLCMRGARTHLIKPLKRIRVHRLFRKELKGKSDVEPQK
jgi:hypothetical protein